MFSEILDVIDPDDQVIGQASEKDIYEKRLSHRIVHVMVVNTKGELLLQKRSMRKAYMPGAWVTSAGGHALTGETYEEAALREMEEEIGVVCSLTFKGKEWFDCDDRPGLKKIVALFEAHHEGPFRISEREVEQVTFFSLGEIKEMVKQGESFHPELLFLLERYYA